MVVNVLVVAAFLHGNPVAKSGVRLDLCFLRLLFFFRKFSTAATLLSWHHSSGMKLKLGEPNHHSIGKES